MMLLLIASWILPVNAAFQLVPQCNGPCMSLCNFAQLGKNIIDLMVWLIFPIATAVLVYGGVMLMISAGSPGRVETGKKAIKAAVVGIFIMAFAWILVNGVIQVMNDGSPFNWSKITCN